MRIFGILKPVSLLFVMMLALAACKSAEERAEEYYQNGLALIAEGDYDRAVVELRNVFQLNGSHQEARHTLAEVMKEQFNNRNDAYGQYLRLVEQYPDDLKARLALSEMAFLAANWDEVERHGAEAERIAPDEPRVQAITLARAYRSAAIDDNAPARREHAEAAVALLEANPESRVLRNILIDNHLRNGDVRDALAGIDWVLERDPDNILYWRQRLNMLGQLNDMDGIEAQLREMVQRFPDDNTNKQALLRFYLSRGQQDQAEGFLRELIAAKPGEPGPVVDLIRYLSQIRGPEAALAEVDKAIETQADALPFRAMRAGLDFEAGRREKAVSDLEAVLAESGEDSTEETRNLKVTLAKMLLGMGNEVGARARVEEILAADETHVEALKMQAAWLIDSDEADAAISALRTALDNNPEDANAMTLMSQAYMRAGRTELAREFLALAVDASGNAPAETIRYAQLLIGEERYLPAEDILIPALRLAPRNTDLLITLGRLYLGMEDMGRVDQVVRTLRQLEDPAALQAANALEAQRINQQDGLDQAMSYLEDLATSDDASMASQIQLVQARLRTGNVEGALTLAKDLTAKDPENEQLMAMLASVQAVNGDLGEAERLYRELLDTNANRPGIWLQLAQIELRLGNPDKAEGLVDEALALMPQEPNLLWAKASYHERNGKIDDAIAIYEGLYARNSQNVIVANNLASLLGTYRDDADSLERAWTIARRFRDAEQPALKDTYGWITHRRGDSADALPYLEAAAAGLQNDPIVQYHLGVVYQAMEQPDKAIAQFRRALDIAGPADQRDQIADARTRIAELEAAPAEQAAEN